MLFIVAFETLFAQKLLVPLLSEPISDKTLQTFLSAVGAPSFFVFFQALGSTLLADKACSASDAHKDLICDKLEAMRALALRLRIITLNL